MRVLQLAALGVAGACSVLAWRVLTAAGLEPLTAAAVAGGAVVLIPPIFVAVLVSTMFVAPKDSAGRRARQAVSLVLLLPLQLGAWYAIDSWWPRAPLGAAAPALAEVPPTEATPPGALAPLPKPDPAPRQAALLLERSYWGDVTGLAEAKGPDGTLYVSGASSESIWFGRAGPHAALRACDDLGFHFAFVARYSKDRTLDWVRVVQRASLAPTALVVFPNGDVLAMVSATADSAVDASEDTRAAGRRATGKEHASQLVLVRYDAKGTLQWRAQLAQNNQAGLGGLALAGGGDAFVWASFSERLVFRGDADETEVDGSPLDTPGLRTWPGDTALLRVTPSGKVAWARTIANEPLNARCAVARPSGGLFIAGNRSNPRHEQRPESVFLAWLDGRGELERMRWATGAPELRPHAGAQIDLGLTQAYPVALAAHSDGAVAVAGYFGSTLKVGDELPALTSAGSLDLWVALFDQGGTLRLADAAGGPGMDVALVGGGLTLNDDTLEVFGALEADTTFGRGTPSAVTLTRAGKEVSRSHAVWRRDGTLVRADHQEAEEREGEPACCNRESGLTVRAKKKPWPAPDATPSAPEVEAWVKHALGGVELGWTLENEVEALLPAPAPRHVETIGRAWSWPLQVAIPGGSGSARAELVAVHGVALTLTLAFEPGKGPKREEVRRFFAPLHRVETEGLEGPADAFCPVSGMRAASLASTFGKDGRAINLMVGGRIAPCMSDDQMRNNGEFLRRMREQQGKSPR